MATKLKNHYITRAARNTSEALMMAMQLWMQPHAKRGDIDGVQEFVETINAASIKLRDICERHEYNMEAAKSKAPNAELRGASRLHGEASLSNDVLGAAAPERNKRD